MEEDDNTVTQTRQFWAHLALKIGSIIDRRLDSLMMDGMNTRSIVLNSESALFQHQPLPFDPYITPRSVASKQALLQQTSPAQIQIYSSLQGMQSQIGTPNFVLYHCPLEQLQQY
jgi:hypothetical protein